MELKVRKLIKYRAAMIPLRVILHCYDDIVFQGVWLLNTSFNAMVISVLDGPIIIPSFDRYLRFSI